MRRLSVPSIPLSLLQVLVLALPACSLVAPRHTSTAAASLPGGKPATGQTGTGQPSAVDSPISTRTAVPLEQSYRSLFVRAVFNGRVPAKLLVDTGAAYVTIHEELARTLGIDLLQSEPVSCILADGSMAQAHRAHLAQIRLSGALLRNVPVLVMPTRPAPTHDGLLGMSFLEHFVVELDAEKSVLWLAVRSRALPNRAQSGPESPVEAAILDGLHHISLLDR